MCFVDAKEESGQMIRLLNSEDKDAYYKVVHEGYSSLASEGVFFLAASASKEELSHWLEINPTYGFFINNDQLVSAMSLIMPWGPIPGPRIAPHLGHVCTLPPYKRQGYSSELFAWIEKNILIKELKIPEITLTTAEEHSWLVKMYEKWGFKVFDTIHVPGKKHTSVYMHKIYTGY